MPPPLIANWLGAVAPVAQWWPARKMSSTSTMTPSASAAVRWCLMRILERLLAVDAEQHDHEQEQHDDRAGVDDHLHRREQVRLLLDEEDRHAHQRDDEQQRRVHRVARQHHAQRAGERQRGEDEEDHRGHASVTAGCRGPVLDVDGRPARPASAR